MQHFPLQPEMNFHIFSGVVVKNIEDKITKPITLVNYHFYIA